MNFFFAKDGEEAENSISNNNFDLILLDMVMPKKWFSTLPRN